MIRCPAASACSRMSIATISVRFDGPNIPTPGLSQHNPGAASGVCSVQDSFTPQCLAVSTSLLVTYDVELIPSAHLSDCDWIIL